MFIVSSRCIGKFCESIDKLCDFLLQERQSIDRYLKYNRPVVLVLNIIMLLNTSRRSGVLSSTGAVV
jgi:hypothetical protein